MHTGQQHTWEAEPAVPGLAPGPHLNYITLALGTGKVWGGRDGDGPLLASSSGVSWNALWSLSPVLARAPKMPQKGLLANPGRPLAKGVSAEGSWPAPLLLAPFTS